MPKGQQKQINQNAQQTVSNLYFPFAPFYFVRIPSKTYHLPFFILLTFKKLLVFALHASRMICGLQISTPSV